MPAAKIATCCYCGTRAALVFDAGQHELVCGSCGAPLHNLKQMPLDRQPRGTPAPAATPARPATPPKSMKKPKKAKAKTSKKGWKRKLLSEIIDGIEDIFD